MLDGVTGRNAMSLRVFLSFLLVTFSCLARARMCPVWLLVGVVLVGVARGARSQCWNHPSCQALDSDSSMMVTC